MSRDTRLFYFTTKEFATQNIEKNRIKVSEFGRLNDLFEARLVNIQDADERRRYLDCYDKFRAENFFVPFSKCFCSPLMWGIYAKNGTGICIEYGTIGEVRSQCIEYCKDLPSIEGDNLEKQISETALRKNSAWSFENESRVLFKKNQLSIKYKEDEIKYIDQNKYFEIKSILIGPFSGYFDDRILPPSSEHIPIYKIRTAFGSFEMTEQLNKTEGLNRGNMVPNLKCNCCA